MLVFVLHTKILPVLAICFVKMCASNPASLRIAGGRDAKPDELPYVVRVELRFSLGTLGHFSHLHVCTAASLTPNWTLTAAHCVEGLRAMKSTVAKRDPMWKDAKGVIRYGFNPFETTWVSHIISTHNHPNFKRMTMPYAMLHNDVSLLKTEPVILAQYAKLSALDSSTLVGLSAALVGYGLTDLLGQVVQDATSLGKPLQLAEVIVKACTNFWDYGLYPSMCVSPRCNQRISLCSGDSGGPLMHSTGIVGINSKGVISDCDIKSIRKNVSSNFVGIITPTSSYSAWIADIIRKDSPDAEM